MPELDASRLVFLDETGSSAAMVRRIAWAPKGQRIALPRPTFASNVSVVSAIALDGVRGTMAIRGAIDGETFLAYLREVLCPNLRPGDIVVMDNLRVHKVHGVVDAIEAVGATVLYQPPYSPDFNPIELMWAWVKGHLRGMAPRTVNRLIEALGGLLQRVGPRLCAAWFKHLGYCGQPS